MYTDVKRCVDAVLSLAAIIVMWQIICIIAAAVWLDNPGPILFRQRRLGMGGRYFDILKFRTMRTDAPKDVPTHQLKNPEQYVTRVGRLLRRTSLDELPQLYNILVGDMSIVGPRPALWNQYDLISIRERTNVNDIRPGLTGLAQIKGRDELPIKVKAKYDAIYKRNESLWLDTAIIALTIRQVIAGAGIKGR